MKTAFATSAVVAMDFHFDGSLKEALHKYGAERKEHWKEFKSETKNFLKDVKESVDENTDKLMEKIKEKGSKTLTPGKKCGAINV